MARPRKWLFGLGRKTSTRTRHSCACELNLFLERTLEKSACAEKLLKYLCGPFAFLVSVGISPWLKLVSLPGTRTVIRIFLCLRVLARNKSSSPINPNSRVGSMFDIFSRSVFERMWCVQEVAVARQVELICGDAWITWDQLISGLATLERAAKFSNDSNKDIELFKNRIALQENLRRALRLATTHPEASRLSLSRLLDATSERGSTNPKDKVFALDGLLRLMGVNMPSPDYSKPVRQIYQDMTVTAIQQDGNLNILYQLTGFPTEYGLSSWVPDFSDTNCPKMISYSAFHASRDSPCRWQFAAGALHLRGKAVVKVATCGAAICEQSTTLRGFCSIPESQRESNLNFDTFKQWSSLANSLSTYPTKESVNDAFMRTLITDLVRGDGLDFDKFFNVCKTWHNMLATGLSADLFFDAGISQMLDDILSLVSQTQARQKQFARSIVAARLAWIITGRTSVKSRARSFHYWLYTMLRRKSFFLTDNGWMGIAPSSVQEGDTVVLFSGLKTPMLIRELDDGRWRLLAPAYVHGMMTGWLWGDNTSLVEFELI